MNTIFGVSFVGKTQQFTFLYLLADVFFLYSVSIHAPISIG